MVAYTFFEPSVIARETNDQEKIADRMSRNYFDGVRENLRLVKRFYPGWLMRLYYNVTSPDVMADLCDLACSEPAFDLCDARKNSRLGDMSRLHPQMWRFMPAVDVQVNGRGRGA